MAKLTAEEAAARQKAIDDANAKSTADADDQTNPPDAPLSPEAQAEADRIAASDEDANTDNGEVENLRAAARVTARKENMRVAQEAHDKLRMIAVSYPQTTPDEHTVFGFGGHVFKLGDLRALFGVPGPRG